MSYTKMSKVSTLPKINREQLARELYVVGATCEVPLCDRPAVSVAESGMCLFMCDDHEKIWNMSSYGRRTVEMTRLEFLQREIIRCQSAAFENPGEEIVWDGRSSIADEVLSRQVALPVTQQRIFPTIQDSRLSTLATLGKVNKYDTITPFLI